LALHRTLTAQLRLQVRSKRVNAQELAEAASSGGGGELTVWVDLGDAKSTRVIFTKGGEVIAEREITRNGATDDVHFEELALAIRSSVEALNAQEPAPALSADPAETPAEPKAEVAVASAQEPRLTPASDARRTDQIRDSSPSPPRNTRTPYRLDFEPTYAATTYARDPNVLFGLGLGFEGVAQNLAANPGVRLSTDTTVAFEFTDSRPRVAHLRTLFTLGIEQWLPARWGLGITAERVILDSGDRRTESQSLLGTLMGEFRLVLGDRVDGVLGTLLDVQLGEPRVIRDDGVALERHRFRVSAYLGVAITAAGER
ncbi:MAG: hypothetical protein KC492_46250, partial [Myxococcales bacterium]|nr:hypothetical protein [Myxococcales bacterium]